MRSTAAMLWAVPVASRSKRSALLLHTASAGPRPGHPAVAGAEPYQPVLGPVVGGQVDLERAVGGAAQDRRGARRQGSKNFSVAWLTPEW